MSSTNTSTTSSGARGPDRGVLIFCGLVIVAASIVLAGWWKPVQIGRYAPSGTDCVVDTVTGFKYYVGNGGGKLPAQYELERQAEVSRSIR